MTPDRPRLNADWHRAHVLGSHVSLDDRVEWHLEHVSHCGCREMPASIRKEIDARGLADRLPQNRGT